MDGYRTTRRAIDVLADLEATIERLADHIERERIDVRGNTTTFGTLAEQSRKDDER